MKLLKRFDIKFIIGIIILISTINIVLAEEIGCKTLGTDIMLPNSFKNPTLIWVGDEYGLTYEIGPYSANSNIGFSIINSDGSIKINKEVTIPSCGELGYTVAGFCPTYNLNCPDSRISSPNVYPSLTWNGNYYGIIWSGGSCSGGGPIVFENLDENGEDLGVKNLEKFTRGISKIIWTGSKYAIIFSGNSTTTINFIRAGAIGNHEIGRDVTKRVSYYYSPTITYNPINAEYGIAWSNTTSAEDEQQRVYFIRLDSQGINIGQIIKLTNTDSTSPSLVWNGNEYGIAWSDKRDGNSEIYFARIDASGNKVGNDVRITNAAGNSVNPSLAWNGNEYGVVWKDSRPGSPISIYFTRIDASGNKVGNDIRISNAEFYMDIKSADPSLAWNGNEYGVVWSAYRNGWNKLYFNRIGCKAGYCGPVGSKQNCEKQLGVCSGSQKTCLITQEWENCENIYILNINYETVETKCGDVLDNDCDGKTDCADSDCASSGLCGCKSDADCNAGLGEKCETTTGVCYIPTPTTCEGVDNKPDCNSVGPFNCYWKFQLLNPQLGDCKPIYPSITTCNMLNYQEVCEGTNIIDCSWVNGECIGEEVPPDEFNFNCEPGTFPQADGNCGTSADPSGVCNLNNVCEYGELCGACADCVGYGMGGCATDAWCDSTIGCTIPPQLSGGCGSTELNDYLGIETFFVNDCEEKCLNTWTIFSEDQLYADVDLDNDGDNECCLGTCSDGQLTSVEGMITFYERGLCNPIEGSPSEGTMEVITNTKNPDGSYSRSPPEHQSCTILPSRRVPFSSVFGVLAGLVIIVLFYFLRKKH